MERIFSYGTLLQKGVQLEICGRILNGKKDTVKGFCVKNIEITDEFALITSHEKIHPIIFFTGQSKHKVPGTVFEVTHDDLLKIDRYEVDEYKRVEVTLISGKKSWIYKEK